MISLLFLGNSYTFVNDLNLATEALLEEGAAAWEDTATTRLAEGGYTWQDHVARVDTDPAWEEALVTGDTPWAYGILQEQSQIPGFHGESALWDDSLTAATQLDAWLQARGAGTVVLLTWGRKDGDETNPDLYPDFPTMQAELTEGTLAYQDALSTAEHPVYVAPIGPAFAVIYDDAVAAGEVPQDGLFGRLYSADGSHPSPTGTHLAACVLYATLTGDSPVGLSAPGSVDAADAAAVQAAVEAVVLSGDWSLPSSTGGGDSGGDSSAPVDSAPPQDTGPADSAAPGDSGVADSGAADTAAAKDPAACGCAAAPGATAGWLGLLLLALHRRRAR